MTDIKNFETSMVVWGDRNAPPAAVAQLCQAVEASGVVDRLALSDQLQNFFPPCLWQPDVMPMSQMLPDPDSLQEAWTTAGYVLHAAPSMGLTLLSDSIRRGPALFVQAMLTLANMTEGRAMFQIGAGEVKNITPYGYKRQGLGRMEDLFRTFHAAWDAGGPFDFDGNHTKMRGATLGGAKPHRPELWGLGEGPRLVDLVTSYADGISSVAPNKFPTPGHVAERREKITEILVQKDRDPEKFRFGMLAAVVAHPDENVVDRALDNPAIRLFSGLMGRMTAADWTKEGLSSPIPEDWNYYVHFKPYDKDQTFFDDVIANTTRRHAELSWLAGTPEQIADRLVPYIDEGISWLGIVDYAPMILPLEELATAHKNSIEICRLIKEKTGTVATPVSA